MSDSSISMQAEVANGSTTVEERVRLFLDEARRQKDLNCFITLFEEKALEQARHVDRKIRAGEATGRLAGLVLAVKDNIVIKDTPTTCGSKILNRFDSPYTATVVERLMAEDAVILGKTNMDEFAMGSSNENSAFGPVKNPHNNQYVPGGSSGGSAVAVAAGLADAALGSDTGGSIRQPASFTGTYGIKPGYGRVSRYGLVAFGSSLDQIGVFASTPAITARVLEVISGHDPRDSTSARVEVPSYSEAITPDMKGMRIGIPGEYFQKGLDPHIEKSVRALINEMEKAGATTVPVSLPMTEYAIAIYYIIATAEASSNLSRFDGVRYGLRADEARDLGDMYARTRSEGFGEEVKRRIMLGTYVLSAGYYDAYYNKAMKVRRLLKESFDAAFGQCDLILSPTTPTTAFKLGEKTDDPLSMYLQDIYTVSANLAGLSAISIPAGKDERGLPFGIQAQAPSFNEQVLFNCAQFIHNLKLI